MLDQREEKLSVRIRWMIRRDMPEALAIEESSFEFPWTEEDFVRCLRQRNCIGMVAERNDKIVGFMIYELLQSELHVLNFAVRKEFRRMGVGSQMMEKLVSKLSYGRRDRIVLEVRETNLEAQLFFKKQTFRAIDVLRDYYEDTIEDAYLMQYKYYPTQADVDWAYQRNSRLAG
ncbi:MAG TPA: ribosomal protein S18-alanine N-acetyltransferase [Pirellulaceae bacterium]|nr:ribosomal protein S18-alanine N-acetyltransferase [Pirellulaceae bacterium]